MDSNRDTKRTDGEHLERDQPNSDPRKPDAGDKRNPLPNTDKRQEHQESGRDKR